MKVSEIADLLFTFGTLLALAVAVPVEDPKQCASYELFYDHGTENCEPCRDICRHADITGTKDQCSEYCPKYMNSIKCEEKADIFYDVNLDICSPCSNLCDNHRALGTTVECQELCKGYMDKLTPEQVPSLHGQNSLKAVRGSDEEPDTSAASLHPGWIAAIVVGSVAVLCTILVGVILYMTCSNQYAPAPQREQDAVDRCKMRQPVEETIQGSRDSQHFAIDAGVPSTQLHTAFSDLRDDGNRNDSLVQA